MRIRQTSTRRHRGYVLALFVVFMVPLMCMVGLIIDMGMMMAAHRKAQNAADAAAMAGALELSKGNTSQVVPEATYFVTTQNNATVPGSLPPQIGPRSGPYQGNTYYVEVYASVTVNTTFLRFLGMNGTQTVQARSVAGFEFVTFNQGLLVLDPNASGALTVSGNGTVSVNGGATIQVNSTNSGAAAIANGNAIVTAAATNIVGGYQENGHGDFQGTINTGAQAISDPLAYLSPPDPNTLVLRSSTQLSITSTTTLQPGVYRGGISMSGQAVVTLSPGVYYIDGGGFSTTGQTSLTGSGVMIYNDPNSATEVFNLAGLGALNLSPPTSGQYQGLTFFQLRSSTAPVSIAGNGGTVAGTVYAAGALTTISGNGGFTGAQLVSKTMNISGNGATNINFGGNTALTAVVYLVE